MVKTFELHNFMVKATQESCLHQVQSIKHRATSSEHI